MAIAVLVALAAFVVLALVVASEPAPSWDQSIFRELYSGATTGPPGAAPNQSAFLADILPLLERIGNQRAIALLAALAIGLLLAAGRVRLALFCGAAFASSLIAGELKDAFGRPAPFESHGGVSFPSGHAMASMSISLAILIVLAPTRLLWPAIAAVTTFVVAVGVYVVADGGHWPSDVLGGWLLAAAWVAALALLLNLPARRGEQIGPGS
jgi:undecaprenyl-diphosphatase